MNPAFCLVDSDRVEFYDKKPAPGKPGRRLYRLRISYFVSAAFSALALALAFALALALALALVVALGASAFSAGAAAGAAGAIAGVAGVTGAAGLACAKAVALAAANTVATRAEISLFMDIPLKKLTFGDRQNAVSAPITRPKAHWLTSQAPYSGASVSRHCPEERPSSIHGPTTQRIRRKVGCSILASLRLIRWVVGPWMLDGLS